MQYSTIKNNKKFYSDEIIDSKNWISKDFKIYKDKINLFEHTKKHQRYTLQQKEYFTLLYKKNNSISSILHDYNIPKSSLYHIIRNNLNGNKNGEYDHSIIHKNLKLRKEEIEWIKNNTFLNLH